MSKIVGLDIGTNSIGHAIVEQHDDKLVRIVEAGSRILPMDQGSISDFESGGALVTGTALRRGFRSVRRLLEKVKLRRSRLHRVLHLMGWLPTHYDAAIDFERRLGQFNAGAEEKLAFRRDTITGKFNFIFEASFLEMVAEFKSNHPQLSESGQLVPRDWTIYYLRKKALSAPIAGEELAWILLQFNQKRGYYQLRGEEEEVREGVAVEYHKLKVIEVIPTGEKKKGKERYEIVFENGWRDEKEFAERPLWEGMIKEFIVTITENRDGVTKRSFRIPKEEDWTLVKKRTESELELSGMTVGEFIYSTLLSQPQTKIKGALIRTIERKFYKEELRKILSKQAEFHPELTDSLLYEQCLYELYPNNDGHRSYIGNRDLTYLLVDDVLFYQRPLKIKKHLISQCPYEYRWKPNKEGGYERTSIQCIAKSNPLYQEFRIWQFLRNLCIYQREVKVNGRILFDQDVTAQFLPDEESWCDLFDWVNSRDKVKQDDLLKYLGLKRDDLAAFRWNFVEEKMYPGNETRHRIIAALRKALLTVTAEEFYSHHGVELWHLIYSVSDKEQYKTAISTFASKHNVDEHSFCTAFERIKPFEKEYGAYSEKAIRKLLSLMRMGKYWSQQAIDPQTMARIECLVAGEENQNIKPVVREHVAKYGLQQIEQFRGLPLHLACYVVYNRHSESSNTDRWEKPEDIDAYLDTFRRHSMNNPVVEQVVLETLRVVRDLWIKYGTIDEIHIELGREMKNPRDKRASISQRNAENEATNLRVRAILEELKNQNVYANLLPYSLSHQERFKIFEEDILSSGELLPDDIFQISKMAQPSASEIQKYTLWLEQRYTSPYTGQIISLSRLFTRDYEIEHVIPKDRFYDDSLTNKVICESAVNKLKDKMLGFEFIQRRGGEIVDIGNGKRVTILKPDAYQAKIKELYKRNQRKCEKLLMEDIPQKFVERQLNDTRYISRFVMSLLSRMLRKEGEDEATSRRIVVCTGGITTRLKQDWGMNDIWNDLVYQRFERLNKLVGKPLFGSWIDNKFHTEVPLELQKGFRKKRIDHRHHALDAIIIACASRNIVNYLNNSNAGDGRARTDLKKLIFDKEERRIYKPWETFSQDARAVLSEIVVSFKSNTRVITKTSNRYWKWLLTDDGKKKRVRVKQQGDDLRAVRKPLHKETVAGAVSLQRKKQVRLKEALENWTMIVDKGLRAQVKELVERYKYDSKSLAKYFKDRNNLFMEKDVSKVEVYYFETLSATRKSVDSSFNAEKISSITDHGIQKILLNHLSQSHNDPSVAFSPEGVALMNERITELNDGKWHQPIQKVRVAESMGLKFNVGEGAKATKFVEAAKGTNLFFAIYTDEQGKRSFESIPLNVVVERLKQGDSAVPPFSEGRQLLMTLSPNELVYVPTVEEVESGSLPSLETIDKGRVYRMVSSSRGQSFFAPSTIAAPIVSPTELGFRNKSERAWDETMIKSVCRKLHVDRLGTITKIE